MNTLRNIWADLVEKRLWPVAALLAAGLVAVPVVLAKSGDEAPPPAPAAGVAIAAAAARDRDTVVTLDTAPEVRRHDGRGRDPFIQPKGSTPTKAKALTSATTADAGAGAGSTTSGGSGDDATPQTTTTKPKPKSTGPAYTVDLRFGQADSMKTLKDVTRLTPLPSAKSPFFVFLGAKDDGKTLVFLVSSDAKATGDGKCKPSSGDCETIELRAGDTEFFDLTTDAGVVQYQMDIVKITKSGGASSASGKAARAARAHASKADRRLLRKVVAGRSSHLMGTYRWSPRRGVLVHVPQWADPHPSATLDGPDPGVPGAGTSQD